MTSDQSADNKAVKEELEDSLQEEAGMDSAAAESPEVTPPTLEDKFSALEKEYLYLRAEMENIKRQGIKERSQLLKYGAERLARDLLETLDVFRTALSTDVTSENFQEFVKGVEMTNQSLRSCLEKHGITEVDCVGQPFDPASQEALSSEPTDQFPEGYVTQVFKTPFMYHDKLLRPGQVVVSRPKSE